ncbi:hypothetical protein FVE85_2897 [Porphyridium purpureum]|uniref:Uncharacterized protein n=1 Tax=Porphyridium purpureum TaxID=35688 RepID=A0A5J4YTH7_PORPP|nr:hypothetical protein FVE85_2897 [Porphyridium purpureum]|eukprot:POR8470..scf227_4
MEHGLLSGERVDRHARWTPARLTRAQLVPWGVGVSVLLCCAFAWIAVAPDRLRSDVKGTQHVGADASTDTRTVHMELRQSKTPGSSVSGKYDFTQFISFTINTMGGLEKGIECEAGFQKRDGHCLLGYEDPFVDIGRRFSVMAEALFAMNEHMLEDELENHKVGHSLVDPAENVLKIFAMPDLYWHGGGQYGAYKSHSLMDQNSPINLMLRSTLEVLQHPRYKDWLFILGTMLFYNDTSAGSHKLRKGEVAFATVAPIIRGGPGGKKILMKKEFISNQVLANSSAHDHHHPESHHHHHFHHDTRDAPGAIVQLTAGSEAHRRLKENNITVLRHEKVIVVEGIRVGIEISHEHSQNVLLTELEAEGKDKAVHVHVIVSAGVEIEDGVNPVSPYGVTYMVDGASATSAACRRFGNLNKFNPDTSCRKNDRDDLKSIPWGLDQYSGFFPAASCFTAVSSASLQGVFSRYRKQGCGWTLHHYGLHDAYDPEDKVLPSLDFYPSVKLPAAEIGDMLNPPFGKEERRIKHRSEQTTGRYNATQFIAFTLNTFGGVASEGECSSQSVVSDIGTCYLGAKNHTEDVLARYQILEKALGSIKRHMEEDSHDVIDPSPRTLKIMSLPEFYWRGPEGAYRSDTMFNDTGALVSLNSALSSIAERDEFEDWLFVFGTVLIYNDTSTYAKEHGGVAFFNFAPIVKGGSRWQERYLVTKQYVSGIDFLDRVKLPNPRRLGITEYGVFSDWARKEFKKRNMTLVENNVLEVDGIRIGIEICLDHAEGALHSALESDYNGTDVQVHLITSAGMSIEAGPNPLLPGGVTYISDGSASSAACRRSHTETGPADVSKVCREPLGQKSRKSIPLNMPGYSGFFLPASCFDAVDLADFKGFFSENRKQGCANALSKSGLDILGEGNFISPTIDVYPTVELANPA